MVAEGRGNRERADRTTGADGRLWGEAGWGFSACARDIPALKAKGLSLGDGLGGGRRQERQGERRCHHPWPRGERNPPLPHPFFQAAPKTKGGCGVQQVPP